VNLFIIHRFVLILVLSLSLFMMRRIHQFGAFFFITANISLSLLFFPSFLVVFGEEEEKRIDDVFDFSLGDDDFGRRRRFVFLSLSLSLSFNALVSSVVC
tara:strand:- start:2465 stop:2764 length:300 start_codon:yes stop_codon:yes gene_type:complete